MGGGSDTTQNTQSQSVQQLPPWINDAAQQNYAFAQNVAMQPLQQYQGQMVADVSPQMQQAWNTAATGGNAGKEQYDAAQAGYLGVLGQQPQQVTAGQLSNTDLSPYMNPYTQDVINKTLPIMQQQLALSQNQQQNQANSANAFGGSRQGIQQGVTQAQGAQNMGQMAAQLNQANFGQAQTAATGDINRALTAAQSNQAAQQNQGSLNLQASSGLGMLGNEAQASQLRNFGEQLTAGQMEQQQAQNQINAQVAKFQNAANYPNQQLSILQSALGMTPYEQGTQSASTTQVQQSADPLSAALSGLKAVSSLMPMFGMSDRRMKTDITKVGTHPSGIAIHAYRYKGDPKTYPKVVGPMAEDVAKRFGAGSVAKIPGSGGKMAVHPAIMGALAAPRGPAMGPPISAMSMGGPRMPGPNLAAIAGARPPMGAMAPPIAAGAMGGPRMPGPNLAAIATGGMGPLAGPKPMRARRIRMPQLRGALSG
jgi:hypothetical protein